ncbi:hypothetical protein EVA_22416 [gut metagenome]|uniref:Uncharacterized protein n=1 Tax=gut metagenome TaxID=749906 RepID=J9FIJ6_9ZZZZ
MLHGGVVMPDLGNPNYFKVFKGRFAVESPSPSVPEPHVMLSCVNDVQFMCDFTSDSSGLVLVLPEECRPSSDVYAACRVESARAAQTLEYAVKTGDIGIDVYKATVEFNVPPTSSKGLTASQYDGYTTSVKSAVSAENPDRVNVPVVENRTVEIEVGSAQTLDYIKISPDGKVIGKPLALFHLNGVSFHISGNHYQKGR